MFADSLPDTWGRRLMDEQFRRQGRNPEMVTLLEWLAYVGGRSWGALTYRPDLDSTDRKVLAALDLIASERSARAVLTGNMSEVLPAVIESGASTGGARPKQRIAISATQPDEIWYGKGLPPEGFDSWILKIETDPQRQYGRVECAYCRLAERAGIQVPMFSRPGAGNGLHRQMPVMGKREGITVADLREMGRRHGLKPALITAILDKIAEAASAWGTIASDLKIDEVRMREIRDAWEPVVGAADFLQT